MFAEGNRAIELAASGQAPAAAVALAKATALLAAKRAAQQGLEDNQDSMEVEQDSNKKAKTSPV